MEKMIGKIDSETKKHLDNISDMIGEKIKNCFDKNDSIKKIPKMYDEINELKQELKEKLKHLLDSLNETYSIKDIKSSMENLSSMVEQKDKDVHDKFSELVDKLDAIENYLIDEDNNQYLSQTKDIIEQIGNNWINE
ncbi:MAG: hypothetical protein KA886_02860 [Candidatus Cloacimonetes bacterium]|nr:hypothetical protein [Candidatus Cloacimonadota bacterium]